MLCCVEGPQVIIVDITGACVIVVKPYDMLAA